MKRLLFLIVVITFLASVEAQSFIFKQGELVNYRFRCLDQDTNNYCNTTTQVVFSVEGPSGENILNNISGTTNSTFINISLPTDKIGDYKVFCFSPTSANTTCEMTYKVTFTGDKEAVFPIQFSILLIGLIGVGVSYLNTRLRMMRIGGAVILMTIGVLTIYPGYAGISHQNLLGLLIGTVSIATGAYYIAEDFFVRREEEYFEWMENQR